MAIDESTPSAALGPESTAPNFSRVPTLDPSTHDILAVPPKARKLTVSHFDRRTALRLSGKWLETAGFPVGTRVRIDVSFQRLVVEVAEPEPPPGCNNVGCPHDGHKAKRRFPRVR